MTKGTKRYQDRMEDEIASLREQLRLSIIDAANNEAEANALRAALAAKEKAEGDEKWMREHFVDLIFRADGAVSLHAAGIIGRVIAPTIRGAIEAAKKEGAGEWTRKTNRPREGRHDTKSRDGSVEAGGHEENRDAHG